MKKNRSFLRLINRRLPVVAFLLAAAFLVGIFPVAEAPFSVRVSAEEVSDIGVYPAEGGNLYFDKATGTLLSCDPMIVSAEIPRTVNGVPVTKIGDSAFSGCVSLTSVSLPDTLTEIGAFAFSDCTSLAGISIPESVKTIGTAAFIGCASLSEIIIPAGVTALSSPVEGESAESIEILRQFLFYGCMNLKEIRVSKDNPVFASLDGVLFSKDLTHLLVYPAGKEDEVYLIPDTMTDVDPIGLTNFWITTYMVGKENTAFSDSEGFLMSYDGTVLIRSPFSVQKTLPSGVKKIGNFAFSSCVADSVVLPDSVTEIGTGAFFMSFVSSLSLPAGLEKIGDGALYSLFPAQIVYRGTKAQWESVSFDKETAYPGMRITDSDGNVLFYLPLPGDLNDDGEVNGQDGVLMARYLAKWNVEIDSAAADIDGDGKINTQDGVLLARYLAYWDVPYFNS